jgi:ubiquinone/menaquinone biosynthesis C-methylase UbiE
VSTVRHPVFARAFDRMSRLMERDLGRYRRELVSGLSGRVLEVGAGNGMNFGHYPSGVEEVIALEPEPYLRRKAQAAARRAEIDITVQPGVAAPLEFGDASFDAAVMSLVLCTIPDQAAALSELRRVLRPGGELRFVEHVRSERPPKAAVQRGADRSGLWPALAGGCHCSRDTVAAIRAAGFEVDRCRSFDLGPGWLITNPHVLGSARTGGV